jgi:hypothetical protein
MLPACWTDGSSLKAEWYACESAQVHRDAASFSVVQSVSPSPTGRLTGMVAIAISGGGVDVDDLSKSTLAHSSAPAPRSRIEDSNDADRP